MRVDLNADVGESFGRYVLGQDPALMRHITSANIACGFHAGDAHVMRKTVQLARDCGVAIGAHPGFPDLAGFGRRTMMLGPDDIADIVVYQVGALAAMAAAEGTALTHVKPHGALYNQAATEADTAAAIARAVAAVNPGLILVGLAGSELIRAGREAGLRTAAEVFADRGYDGHGRLLDRRLEGAVIDDVDEVCRRAVHMTLTRSIRTHRGTDLPSAVDTICIHGDTPGASGLAQALQEALTVAGVRVAALTS